MLPSWIPTRWLALAGALITAVVTVVEAIDGRWLYAVGAAVSAVAFLVIAFTEPPRHGGSGG